MTVRQLFNLAAATLTEGMDENQIEQFEEEIGMRRNPEREAQEALRAYQESMGMTFDNPDAPVAPDAKAMARADEETLGRWMGDGRG